jgi:hypothetical protein
LALSWSASPAEPPLVLWGRTAGTDRVITEMTRLLLVHKSARTQERNKILFVDRR